jgi:hypothetical protein
MSNPDPVKSAQAKILSEVPGIYRETFRQAFSGKSRASGVKAFCLNCVGFIRADIRDCTACGCPLYPFRPYQRDDEPE